MIRRVTGISARYDARNSTPLGLAKKALYWQKMKALSASVSFDDSEASLPEDQGCLSGNQDSSGKNLAFFLRTLPKATTIENSVENPISTSPTPVK